MRSVVTALLRWFSSNPRRLPWRQRLDPYAIWVSEIMLQQTQVKTVVPYWERWMAALPTVRALASAPPERVLKLWEGLGYYTRARHLHAAGRMVVEQHGGEFPRVFAQVLALPGIGRYTAGAICSIAFNDPVPILDGNVERVISRLFALRGHPRNRRARARLWALAEGLVRTAAQETAPVRLPAPLVCSGPASALNQALMEFGALVCTPQRMRCDQCPVRRWCAARRLGIAEQLPRARRRAPVMRRRVRAFVVRRGERVWVQQRPERSVNGGLWEFPNVEVNGPRVSVEQSARAALGFTPRHLRALATVRHTITRYQITLEAFSSSKNGAFRVPPTARWVRPSDLRGLAFPSAHRRIAEALEAQAARPAARGRSTTPGAHSMA